MTDECEVCDGMYGIVPVCTVTFTADDTGTVTPVRMCRECVTAVLQAMAQQWHDAAEAGNAAVAEMCRQLGVPLPAEADSDG